MMRLGLGLGLGRSQTAISTGVVPIARLSANARIIAVGDSNTQYGASLSGSTLAYSNLSDLPVLASLAGNYNEDIFAEAWGTVPGWQGSNYGVAGESMIGINPRLTDALRYAPDAMYIAGGTNDGADNSAGGISIANNYITKAQEARAAGVKYVVIRAIPPVAGAQFSTNRHQGRLSFLATVNAFAAANPTWCRVADIYTPNIQATGEAVAGYLQADGLHFTEFGCFLNSQIVKAVFDSITVPGATNLPANMVANNQIANGGTLTGSGGTKTGVTGSLPDGWNAVRTGTSAVVASLVANADTGGQTLQFNITPAAGSGSDSVAISPIANLALTAGNWYQAWTEIEVTNGGRISLVHPGTDANGNNTFSSQAGISYYTKQFLRTPPFKATGASKPAINLVIPQGGAAFVARIKRVFVVPVVSPYTTWGVTTPPVNIVAPSVSIPGARAVGSVVTINPGTWTGVLGGSQQQKRYRAALYRDGVFVSNIDFSGVNGAGAYLAGSYTLVAADVGKSLRFDVSAANQAENRSAAISASLGGDITAPVLQSAAASANTNTIVLTYDEVLKSPAPSISAFTLANTGGTDTITGVAVSGRTIVITKSRSTQTGDTMTLDYAVPGANPIADLAGNNAAAIVAQSILISDVLMRLQSLGAQMVETVNGSGYNYNSSATGFSGTGYGVSNKKLPSGQDGYLGVKKATSSLVAIMFKSTQVAGSYNSGVLGAYSTAANGAYSAAGAGSTVTNATNSAAGDEIRLRRAGSSAFFEVRRAAGGAWITVFTWATVTTADLWLNVYCGTTAAQNAQLPYGSPNVI
ncbi:GDSL-type esterase/lipase family protein [Mesorhizobium sp. C386A]|uniref:GDSL-type esterase/lipase family protein n=1 Tax=unclassified Mesorhizobium TaxID=325217 RepID=UPI000A01ABFE|nr:GDSL-type esterase/lipase family protein [Mesorhizobium sp. LNJC386A00]